jgi:hypothetical protein
MDIMLHPEAEVLPDSAILAEEILLCPASFN